MDITTSPFHAGEREVQERLGVRDKIEAFARRVVRNYLPDQHRKFYEMLPFVLLGTVDATGQPWASLVAGKPGFITSPDSRTLDIAALPIHGYPLIETLKPGADIGLLGIQLETRRRNRLTGRIGSVRQDGFTVEIRQTFGNCPQYIQTRGVEIISGGDNAEDDRRIGHNDRLDGYTRTLIENSDTLFIATAYSEDAENWSHGADVSHRGGRPGFVKIEDDRTFVFPDYSGNNHFNTVGNIVRNPKAGFLFADFDTGSAVYISGEAEIDWESPEIAAFAGAERLIRCRVNEVITAVNSLPLQFNFNEYSPMLDHTGSWEQAAQTLAAEKERNQYIPYEVFDLRRESELITSYYLHRVDGKALAAYAPGQFLPIRLSASGASGADTKIARTYTVSDAPNGDYYRLSIKREGGTAQASNFFHDQVDRGFSLEAMAPRGKFILDQLSNRPAVLISAGVGVTPMIAMANHIINEGNRTRNFRPTYFIHGAKNSSAHAFREHIERLDNGYESFSKFICYSEPEENDKPGVTHEADGRIDIALLKQVLPFDDYDFYICGPQPFMQALYDSLTELGVREERIHYESFGPATVFRQKPKPVPVSEPGVAGAAPVNVSFSKSGVDVEWSPDKGTLLELAEAAGLDAAFSCRSGICGTCATRLQCGAVDYVEEATGPHSDDEVLICCSTPRTMTGEKSCGDDCGVVLDL